MRLARRQDVGALDHLRAPLGVEERHQRLADAELGDRLLGVELRIGAHGLGGRLDRLLVARRERAQRVLDAIAELAEHRLRHVERVLRDEVDADALRADQAHDLLDLVQQRLRRVGEQQMRLVEEEDELRLVAVADLGQPFVQLGEQPQQQRRIQLRRVEQLVRDEDVDHAVAAVAGLEEVVDVEHRLADELARAPCCSSASRPRWIAPTLAAETLP